MFEPHSGIQVLKKRNVSSLLTRVSSHNPREVLLAHFSLDVHKGGLKPHSVILFLYI